MESFPRNWNSTPGRVGVGGGPSPAQTPPFPPSLRIILIAIRLRPPPLMNWKPIPGSTQCQHGERTQFNRGRPDWPARRLLKQIVVCLWSLLWGRAPGRREFGIYNSCRFGPAPGCFSYSETFRSAGEVSLIAFRRSGGRRGVVGGLVLESVRCRRLEGTHQSE